VAAAGRKTVLEEVYSRMNYKRIPSSCVLPRGTQTFRSVIRPKRSPFKNPPYVKKDKAPVHAKKAYRGSGGTALLILNLIRWTRVVYFTSRSLYLRKRTRLPIEKDAEWALQPVRKFCREENPIFSLPIFETRTVQPQTGILSNNKTGS
jgi:hypothetical protein